MTGMDASGNIFRGFTVPDKGEVFQEILRCGNVLIERIVSSDSFPVTEYCQEQDEWVLLVAGNACIEIGGVERILAAGDYLLIRAGTHHRVVSAGKGTLWLAIHVFPAD